MPAAPEISATPACSSSSGGTTGGAPAVVEHPFPVGALVPPHLHTFEDESDRLAGVVERYGLNTA